MLGDATTTLVDRGNTVNIVLTQGTLQSDTEQNVFAGKNAAAIGAEGRWEIIQWETAVIVGTLTGNLTINAPSNPHTGRMLVFGSARMRRVGGRTITWNAAFNKATDGAGTTNQKGATSFVYDGANWVQVGGRLAWA